MKSLFLRLRAAYASYLLKCVQGWFVRQRFYERQPALTNSDLVKIHKELSKLAMPPQFDSKGRPCYSFRFVGTKSELKQLRKKLSSLDA